MTIAHCPHCSWEVDVFGTREAADRARDRHIALRHPGSIVSDPDDISRPAQAQLIPSLASADWRTQALAAVEKLAATGHPFTIFDVAHYGVEEPPDPAHDWGRLARDARHLGLIEPVKDEAGDDKAVPSKRRETKGSLVKVWRGVARSA